MLVYCINRSPNTVVTQHKNCHLEIILRLSPKTLQLNPTIPAHLLVEIYTANVATVRCNWSYFLSKSCVILTPKGQFLDCATSGFSERNTAKRSSKKFPLFKVPYCYCRM
jgi:hypothetical protein